MWTYRHTDELYHHGVLGMKRGVRRYQNKDGSLTKAGKVRYNEDISHHTKYLTHHGINGQRWGVRNGPPYPLSKQTSNAIKKTANKTVGDLKTEHRSNVAKIRSGSGSSLSKSYRIKRENASYKKALLTKEKQDSQIHSPEQGKKIAKKVLITVGVVAAASIAGYAIYKYKSDLGKNAVSKLLTEHGGDTIKDFLDPATGKNLTYKGKDSWLGEQVSKGLIGQANTFATGAESGRYNTANLFNGELWNSLSFAERGAVRAYTGESYFDMNNALRDDFVEYESKKLQSLINNCTKALEKSRLSEDVFVHRGVDKKDLHHILDVDPEFLKNPAMLEKLKGEIITEKGFFSSSGSEDSAFKGVKLHAFAPKGTQGMYVDPISKKRGEYEFLLQRNTKFKIQDFKTNDEGSITDLMLSVVDQILN